MSCEIIKISKGTTAIICGAPGKCRHDHLGEEFLCINGEWVPYSLYFKNWMDRDQVYRHAKNEDLNITGGTSSCSKCKQPNLIPIH